MHMKAVDVCLVLRGNEHAVWRLHCVCEQSTFNTPAAKIEKTKFWVNDPRRG
jgi:hypothetical protein